MEMEEGKTMPPMKISKWNRLLNVKTRDIFEGLKGVLEGILNAEAGTAAKAGWELLEGIVSEKNDELPHRAYLLVYGAMRQGLLQLVSDNPDIFLQYCDRPYEAVAFQAFVDKLEETFDEKELKIDLHFFSHADQFPLVELIRPVFQEWMTNQGIPAHIANPLGGRIRFYFVRKLNELWKEREAYFKPLQEKLTEHFQLERVRGRYNYHQSLVERWSERMFDEAFGLDAVYVPLNGCYPLPTKDRDEKKKHQVVDAETHVWDWLHDKLEPKLNFKTLVLKGGPGSGKSSLMKRIAKRIVEETDRPVYFVQLQWFQLEGDFETAIKDMIRKNEHLADDEDPFSSQNTGSARKPVFIFDGLDELSRSGDLGKTIASDFIAKLKSTFGGINQRTDWDVRAIVTGRDFVIQQAAEATHAAQGQVLELLPYFLLKPNQSPRGSDEDYSRYALVDEAGLLMTDRRDDWWKAYQAAKGIPAKGIPKEVKRNEYDSLSTQPLLSYLLARAHSDDLLGDPNSTNINFVYEGLVDALRTRRWGGKDGHKHTSLSKEDFFKLLEEMAITAWHHGDVRTTNLRRFEDRCKQLRIEDLLTRFDESQQGNATKLVIAIFAKGKERDRDGNDLVEFTHKSFGEYLVARRLARLAEEVAEMYEDSRRRAKENAMEEWLITCSQSEVTENIWPFLQRQVALDYSGKEAEAGKIQKTLASLISDFINKGFDPHLIKKGSEPSKDSATNLDIIRASRNAESSLLLTISAFARVSEVGTVLTWRDKNQPHELFQEIFQWSETAKGDCFYAMIFERGINLVGLALSISNLITDSVLASSKIDFSKVVMQQADLIDAKIRDAEFKEADLNGLNAWLSNLASANFEGANLEGAQFVGCVLENCQFVGSNLHKANFSWARVNSGRFERACLRNANFQYANLINVNFLNTELDGANFAEATMIRDSREWVEGKSKRILKRFSITLGNEILDGQEAYDYLISRGAINVPKPKGMK